MYSQNSVLTDFRFRNFGHFSALFGNTYSATFQQYWAHYAQYSAQFGTFRQHWAQLGTFRRFSEIILASILLLGNQTAWHVNLSFWIAIGYLTVSTSNTHQILSMFCRIVPNSAEYWALFGTFGTFRQLFGTFRQHFCVCVCVLLIDDS